MVPEAAPLPAVILPAPGIVGLPKHAIGCDLHSLGRRFVGWNCKTLP